tara:strand:+ start:132 stop:362 length:231 start_codon:yes stop_codon:yes gene_type:complete
MSSVKSALINHPLALMGVSIGGLAITISEMFSPVLQFIILLASTVTAIALAYTHFKRAVNAYHGNLKPKKKKGKKK